MLHNPGLVGDLGAIVLNNEDDIIHEFMASFLAIIGRVVLGGYLLAVGDELNHWLAMLENPNQQHTQWHELQ